MTILYNLSHKEFRNGLLSKSNLERLFINLKSLSFPYWSLCLACTPQFNSGRYVRRRCPSLICAPRLAPVSGSEFLWNILEKCVFIMLRLFVCFCLFVWFLFVFFFAETVDFYKPLGPKSMNAQSIQIMGFGQRTLPLLKLYSLPSLMIGQLALLRVWFVCLFIIYYSMMLIMATNTYVLFFFPQQARVTCICHYSHSRQLFDQTYYLRMTGVISFVVGHIMCSFYLLSDKVAYIFYILNHTTHMCLGNYRLLFQNINIFELNIKAS